MKIKHISCDRFAGLHNAHVSLSDGLNLIYGKNESGKSTLVSLLSSTLFRDARVGARGKKDVEFSTAFCPVKKDGTVSGTLDGKVVFESEGGEFTLSKEWRIGKEGSVKLSTEDDTYDDGEEISRICRDALQYGPAVYTELLFSPQRGADEALKSILAGGAESGAELTAVLTAAFGESGGASVDVIAGALEDKIAGLAGSHWDVEAGAPVRRARYQNGLGVVLKAYYEVEDAESGLARLRALEDAAAEAKRRLQAAEEGLLVAKKSREEFRTVADLMKDREKTQTILEQYGKEIAVYREALQSWPVAKSEGAAAERLSRERSDRKVLDRLGEVKKLQALCDSLQGELEGLSCPTEDQIRFVERAEREIRRLKNLLCGMNLSAILRMQEGHTAEIISLRTGERIDLQDGKAGLSEAVRITVPGVMELELAPADVDVQSVSEQVRLQEKGICEIFEKFGAESVEDLRSLALVYREKENCLKDACHSLALCLNGSSVEELEEAASKIDGEPREIALIERDIRLLCGGAEPEVFAAGRKTVLAAYEKAYGTQESLEALLSATTEKYEEAKKKEISEDRIPPQYRGVDPAVQLRLLEERVSQSENDVTEKAGEKSAAEQNLKNFLEGLGEEDPEEILKEKKRVFQGAKEELDHWVRIQRVFLQEKEKLQGNPMLGLAKSFARYLEMITDGTVEGALPSRERVDVEIFTKDRPMDFAKLSEGTKETVSLAFRLAVLDELFPEGGGVIVFDDPFTDMDDDRTARGCEMILECARRHQVIFLTCREEYARMLQGNLISL